MLLPPPRSLCWCLSHIWSLSTSPFLVSLVTLSTLRPWIIIMCTSPISICFFPTRIKASEVLLFPWALIASKQMLAALTRWGWAQDCVRPYDSSFSKGECSLHFRDMQCWFISGCPDCVSKPSRRNLIAAFCRLNLNLLWVLGNLFPELCGAHW